MEVKLVTTYPMVKVVCTTCAVVFGLPSEVADTWQSSGHKFKCPNDHENWWAAKPSKEEITIKDLKEKVSELTKKLEVSVRVAEAQKKRADELAAELEIWKPSKEE